MYVIKVDGQVLYSPALSDAYHILSPSLSLEVNKAGSLSFTMPPGHAMYDAIQKMKSIITVEQDGEEIFRGRALDETTDFYNQKEVYCEGELAFLLDSLQRPYTFEGTASDFLRMMIQNHNEQVDEAKRFTVGKVTAVEDSVQLALENIGYSDTLTALESVLLDVYKGYFRIRYEGGVRYLDYLLTYGENSGQKIEFGVNMLDLDSQIDAKEIFTVLVPLGGINDDGETITIESVNDGLDYIENADAIAQYGRIVKTHSWDDVTDPAELYELGYKKLMDATTADTLNIKAVDLHLLNGDTDKISLGDNVHLLSAPHGLDRDYTCEAIDINIFDPEKTAYRFGPKVDTMADNAASMASLVKKHSGDLFCHLRHIKETEKAVSINIQNIDAVNNRTSAVSLELDAVKATIELKASQYEVDELGYRVTNAEIGIDGANAAILLKADKTAVSSLETRVSNAEIAIDGANAAISLKADKSVTDELGKRMSTAEADIDAANAAINLLANASDLSGLETRVSSAEAAIDGMEAQIALKASLETVNEQEKRLSTAEANIDAANAAIKLKADKTVTDDLGTRMSTAEADIDAANAAIDLLANVEDLSDLEKRVSSAEVAIDGANAAIALKADKSVVNAQGERLSTAEANIDAANAEILLRAKTTTVDALTNRVSAAEASIAVNAEAITSKVSKDGVISSINQTAEEVTIKASKINLSGYVTTSKLSSEIASINTSISTKVTTSSISAANAAFTNIEFGGAALRLRTGSFVTAVTLPKVSGKYIWYMDDTMDVVQQYVLTGFTQGEVTTASLPYVGT